MLPDPATTKRVLASCRGRQVWLSVTWKYSLARSDNSGSSFLYFDEFELLDRWRQAEVLVAVCRLQYSRIGAGREVDDVRQYVRVRQLRGEVGDVLGMDQAAEENVVPTGQDLQAGD